MTDNSNHPWKLVALPIGRFSLYDEDDYPEEQHCYPSGFGACDDYACDAHRLVEEGL